MTETKEIEKLLKNLSKEYDFAIIGDTVGVWRKLGNINFGYNISGYLVELFQKNGFNISFITIHHNGIPRIEFIKDVHFKGGESNE